MPRAYLIAIAESSSLDHETQNLSLFKLVEQIQIPSDAAIPAVVGYEVHSYWEFETDEIGKRFDARMVTEGSFRMASDPISFVAEKTRMRLRAPGVGLPSLGQLRLSVEICAAGSNAWMPSAIWWPLLVEQAQTTDEVARATVAAARG